MKVKELFKKVGACIAVGSMTVSGLISVPCICGNVVGLSDKQHSRKRRIG